MGDKDLFVWTYHHMLLDGRSMLTVMKEVSLFYEAYCSNQNLELPRPPNYADYIDWFYRQDQSDSEQYWRKLLGTFTTPVKVDLPRESDVKICDLVSLEEWQMRVDLAAVYRLVAEYGWDDLVFTHISARVPGPEHHFLINPRMGANYRD